MTQIQRTLFAVAATILLVVGCTPTQQTMEDAQVDLTIEPSPPVVGDAQVSLVLADAAGKPLAGADVQLEGNMNHAGMKPSFAEVTEVEPGKYTGTIDFTMGGDWFILVTAKMPDGRQIEKKIDVKGVKAN